jgi:acyl-[acyl-carrier-protein]-phospholipid O-acyltransferase/long-chain-fatty-acid--[acyl-carrier-protein] ligase
LGVFNDNAFKMVSVLVVAGQASSYSSDATFLSIMTVVYVLPFLIFPAIAGWFSDRFEKRFVMVGAKVAELLVMLLGMACLAFVEKFGYWPLVGVMFLMSAQSAFFSPAFNGLLPEAFSEREISKANGDVGLATFIAIIVGVGAGALLKGIVGENVWICGLVFSIFSLGGIMCAAMAPVGREPARKDKLTFVKLFNHLEGLGLAVGDKTIFHAILGEGFFLAVGASLQMALVIYAKHVLGSSDMMVGAIQFVPALGMGFGCWFAGRLSRGKVELGLVPFGALGLCAFFLFLAHAPLSEATILSVTFHPFVVVALFLLGLSGGFFVVPLRAYQQEMSAPETRGKLLASANFICFSIILLSGLLMFYLTSGSGPAVVEKTSKGFLNTLQSHCLSLHPSTLFTIMAAATAAVTLYAFLLVPAFSLRVAVISLTRTIYRLTIRGDCNIPAAGPALIVSNHVSYVDGFLLSAASSRTIRFMIHEDFYYHPMTHWFYKWFGFIPVAAAHKPKALKEAIIKARKALESGEVVCIFPEGHLTRDGMVGEFKKGYLKMFPPGRDDIPLVPAHLGNVWGSVFTYFKGGLKFRWPRAFPYPVTVSFGEHLPSDAPPWKAKLAVLELAAAAAEEPAPGETPLHRRFAEVARRHPFTRTFVDAAHPAKGPGNFALLAKALLLSRVIRGETNRPRVGVLLPNAVPAVATTLAVMFADKVPAALNFSLSSDALRKAVEKADLDVILTSRKFIEKAKIEPLPEMLFLEDIADKIGFPAKLLWSTAAAALPARILTRLASPLSSTDVYGDAVVLFSSGSSGEPKAVLLSHHNVNSNVRTLVDIVDWQVRGDSLLGNLPLFHSFGMTTSFWLPAMTGARVFYIPNPLDAALVVRTIERNRLTILLSTPTFLQAYLRKAKPESLKSLRLAITGAEKLRTDLAERFAEAAGTVPIEGYGCTELSPVASLNSPDSIIDIGKKAGTPGSVGKAVPGVAVKTVDPDTAEEIPEWGEGKLMVKGPNVMKGYLNDPAKTAEVLRDGWYDTGDIARIDSDGRIFITGRISRFSKIGGEMVPHEMVEEAVNRIIGGDARLAAVTGLPDTKKGEKLVVLLAETAEMPPGEIVKALREDDAIPNLWIPKPGDFLQVDGIPLLASGKMDLRKLRAMAEEKTGAGKGGIPGKSV